MRLHIPFLLVSLAELKHWRYPVKAEQHRPEQSRKTRSRAEHWGVEMCSWRGVWHQGDLTNSNDGTQLDCFALNKVSFTASQIDDSCWHWIVTTDYWLMWYARNEHKLYINYNLRITKKIHVGLCISTLCLCKWLNINCNSILCFAYPLDWWSLRGVSSLFGYYK